MATIFDNDNEGYTNFSNPFRGGEMIGCSSCKNLIVTAINLHKGFFCCRFNCNNYIGNFDSGVYQQLYGKYKLQRFDEDTDYCPSDEDPVFSKDRVLIKLNSVETTENHFSGDYMLKEMNKLVKEGTVHEDNLPLMIESIRKDYKYKPSRGEFLLFCDSWMNNK